MQAGAAEGALAVEMEAATLFAVGANAGIQVACILVVSDTFDGPDARARIDDDALTQAAEAMGSSAHGRTVGLAQAVFLGFAVRPARLGAARLGAGFLDRDRALGRC